MSNTYLSFDADLALHSIEEKEWFEKTIQRCVDLAEMFEEGAFEGQGNYSTCPLENYISDVLQGEYLDVNYKFWGDLEEDHFFICFSAEEGGDLEFIALLVQEYLKTFAPDRLFSLNWAVTGDGYDGGAFVVSATEQKWVNLYDWVQNTAKEMKGG